MSETREAGASRSTSLKAEPGLLEQYGCGPIWFSGIYDGLYERHLLFDDVVAPTAAGAHERFRAAARSIRDVLAQRWVLTETTYDRENPKRVYYLSMEFLVGRSLGNNITNLLLDSAVKRAVTQRDLDWLGLIPMPALETAGSDGWRRVFSTRWQRCSCRPWVTAYGTNTASSSN